MTARDVDVLVIGSGFGGSVAALRLAEKGYRVAVLEAGRRFGADDFARTNWDLRRYLFMPRLGLHGIQRISMLDDLVVLSGAGVGGGSLVYANTLYEPLDPFYDDPQWSAIADWRAELAPFYALARRMLGVVETPFETPAEDVVREVARRMGVGDTFHRTPVGVYFGDEDGVDPYFGGAGPPRSPCIRCGGCMVGCRHNAKNTLDRNYLWLAERAGAVVHPDREATLLRRTDGGWEVEAVRPGAWTRTRLELFRAEHVVLAAGRARHAAAPVPLRARRSERRRARPLQLGGDRRRRRTRCVRRLLGRHRHRLVVPSERGDAHRAGALPEGLEHDGTVLDDPRRRRGLHAAPRALAPRGRAATPVRSCAPTGCAAGPSGR